MIGEQEPHAGLLQVCLYTCGDLIASVPFFEDAEEGFTTSLITLLRPAVTFLPFDPFINQFLHDLLACLEAADPLARVCVFKCSTQYVSVNG